MGKVDKDLTENYDDYFLLPGAPGGPRGPNLGQILLKPKLIRYLFFSCKQNRHG